MTTREFKLPDPGEGLTEAEIVTWRVAVGDTVAVNDIVVEIETAKSLVELPIPFAGIVTGLLVDEGTEVEVGTPIIAVDTSFGEAGSEPRSAATDAESEVPAAKPELAADTGDATVKQPQRTAVLVGYGVKATSAVRRPRKKLQTPPEAVAPDIGSPHQLKLHPTRVTGANPHPRAERTEPLPPPPPAWGSGEASRPLAKPSVRKLAKDLGVDLTQVEPTGNDGVITRFDVEAYVAGSGSPSGAAKASSRPTGAREERIPIKGVRKATAAAMVSSAFTAPHVTEWVEVDVSATMAYVDRLRADREFAGLKVTPLLLLARAMCLAVRRNPGINASWDEAAQEIVVKHYVNLGIAAATPRGLVVPNIKDADALSLPDLARAISALTETAREGRTQPADFAGGTLTITNVGVFSVDSGTPILNPGESAILAFGAIRRKPWVVTAADGSEAIEPRWVTTLALSFDHRLVDGELGSRYLADVAALLHDPAAAFAWA